MIGYWLIPAEPQKSHLAALIAELATKYDAPMFEPHVTLYSGDADEQSARELVHEIAQHHRRIELAIRAVEHSEKLTKTLFVQFENRPEAQQLSDAFRAAAGSAKGYEFDPHLSLMYADVRSETKSAEAYRVQLPFERVAFDSVAAIHFPRPIKSRADVAGWRTIATAQLHG